MSLRRRSVLSRRTISGSFSFSKSFKESKTLIETGNQHRRDIADEEAELDGGDGVSHGRSWSSMLPEILLEVIKRVEESEDRWPLRQSVVTCGCVCRSWREVTRDIVRSPLQSGKITFPSGLKQPGPRNSPLQCLIRRNKTNSTFYLYLALTPSLTDMGKFLLAARRYRHGAHTEYIISLATDDFSQGSNAYVGKLSLETPRLGELVKVKC